MTVWRLFVTGMSGTGKSTLVAALREQVPAAVVIDMDAPGWSFHDADGHQLWHGPRLAEAIAAATRADTPLIVSGCSESQGAFLSSFTHRVLLTAPRAVLIERVRTRSGNDFGKRPGELDRILADLDQVEPLLHRHATLVVSTDRAPAEVVALVRRHVEGDPPAAGARP